ncbi:rfaE bifunctional protein kinase chain/domain/rfaE bifunctional protein nucleotidyltransferase chain/domain [Stackebrandtia albiflava]|uniref:RfaE bifunctional protein kinase chain/domain/rfaE bifunctional protein nucleotidyltransferase chain/domain n=1 Tax=Stackebrandtia albiflava TaxID=406432 RepID=A0A562VA23_9ACTN|nr:PfkB family carbohydrate kinase [Stackebrandtia albiflava]TWJ14722.1 rfaE bifunctional protein kinase chain/domain/rfaE bifunctional protein nucleotidyltransferase chain/domain [Stackebrandtia albiflava]
MKPLLIIGDALLDVDVDGPSHRLSPEAAVPVVDVAGRRCRPGGAGLAAWLAAGCGHEVVLLTALGSDPAGRELRALLSDRVEILDLGWRGTTITKTRVHAAGLPQVRLDEGAGTVSAEPLPPRTGDVARAAGAVLVADYGHGVTAHPEVRALASGAADTVPLVWDPHPRGTAPVPGATVVCPNRREAAHFLPGEGDPATRATGLRRLWNVRAVAVTVGDDGAYLARDDAAAVHVPVRGLVPLRPDLDTCGAGDRFAVAAAGALHSGRELADAVAHAVASASEFVAAGGAGSVTVSRTDIPLHRLTETAADTDGLALADRIRRTGGRLVATGGCFDVLHPGHVALLTRARELGDALVVCLNSDESVRQLKGPDRPIIPAEHRARQLQALRPVDAVTIFAQPTPVSVLEAIRPDVWVKGGDYDERTLPETPVVHRHGGRVVILPTLDGYSTTGLLGRTAGTIEYQEESV